MRRAEAAKDTLELAACAGYLHHTEPPPTPRRPAHLEELVELLELVVLDRDLLDVANRVGEDRRFVSLGLVPGINHLCQVHEPATGRAPGTCRPQEAHGDGSAGDTQTHRHMRSPAHMRFAGARMRRHAGCPQAPTFHSAFHAVLFLGMPSWSPLPTLHLAHACRTCRGLHPPCHRRRRHRLNHPACAWMLQPGRWVVLRPRQQLGRSRGRLRLHTQASPKSRPHQGWLGLGTRIRRAARPIGTPCSCSAAHQQSPLWVVQVPWSLVPQQQGLARGHPGPP